MRNLKTMCMTLAVVPLVMLFTGTTDALGQTAQTGMKKAKKVTAQTESSAEPTIMAKMEEGVHQQKTPSNTNIKAQEISVKNTVGKVSKYLATSPTKKGFTKDHIKALEAAIQSGLLTSEELAKAKVALNSIQ